jgi:DNA-binding NtrC family response regulator
MAASRILVVDDEVETCRNLSDILTDLGHEVAIAHNGVEALRLLGERTFDVALLDFKMPGMDGLTLYREIKKLRPEIVAIVVTAYATRETTDSALQAGAWRVLSKPVDLTLLMSLVDEAATRPLVLVVDDDHDLCASLWDVLHERGFRVSLAHDEAQAREALSNGGHSVVLIDLKLPQGNGAGVYQLVRRANPQARVVLITGYRQEMQRVIDQVVEEGADAVCYKPFDVPELISTIEHLADRPGGRHA